MTPRQRPQLPQQAGTFLHFEREVHTIPKVYARPVLKFRGHLRTVHLVADHEDLLIDTELRPTRWG